MKYIKQSVPNNSAELVRQCLSGLKKINLDLTEGELIQIANHVPLFPVEIHLVNRLITPNLLLLTNLPTYILCSLRRRTDYAIFQNTRL